MTTQQLILSLVLAAMVFSVALELLVEDFARVVKNRVGRLVVRKICFQPLARSNLKCNTPP